MLICGYFRMRGVFFVVILEYKLNFSASKLRILHCCRCFCFDLLGFLRHFSLKYVGMRIVYMYVVYGGPGCDLAVFFRVSGLAIASATVLRKKEGDPATYATMSHRFCERKACSERTYSGVSGFFVHSDRLGALVLVSVVFLVVTSAWSRFSERVPYGWLIPALFSGRFVFFVRPPTFDGLTSVCESRGRTSKEFSGNICASKHVPRLILQLPSKMKLELSDGMSNNSDFSNDSQNSQMCTVDLITTVGNAVLVNATTVSWRFAFVFNATRVDRALFLFGNTFDCFAARKKNKLHNQSTLN